MKLTNVLAWSSALCLSGAVIHAQESSDTEKLRQQLKQLQESFEKQQNEMRQTFERQAREQQAQIDALKRQLEAIKTNPPPAVAPQPGARAITPAELPATQPSSSPQAAVRPWSPTDPIRLMGGQQNYISLSFDALFAAGTSTANDIDRLQLGGHDPKQRGFTIENLETTFEGKVDPYFRGQANIVLQIDPEGETTIEAEEAYLEAMSLPLNLQVKAGQFFTEFGRLNPTHPHTWDFVDQPLVIGRFFGEDGLRNPGARISWLTPTPFYSELYATIQNSQGGTAFSFRNNHEDEPFFGLPNSQGRVRDLGDMLFSTTRYAASFNLTDAQTLVAGASAAFGPNGTGDDADTQVYGVDLFWKWKSPNQHAGFPFVTWQTEAIARRFEAAAFPGDVVIPALPRETLYDWGLYSQVAYGFKKGWVAGFRGDYVTPTERARYEEILGERDLDRASRWRLSPDITYYPSEFSKVRLQYNFDHRNGIGNDHSIWLQAEFLLGTHAAHKF